jgi:hypothetical protein
MMVSTSKSYFFLKNIGGFEVCALFFGHALPRFLNNNKKEKIY